MRGDTCHKGFFRESKKEQNDNLITQLLDTTPHANGNVGNGRFTKQSDLNRIADAFYGAEGGLFNLQGPPACEQSEAQLLDALRTDGKRVPKRLQNLLTKCDTSGASPPGVLLTMTPQCKMQGLGEC